MPNTLLALASLLPFLWFVCFWKKKKKELQHIVVFNIYKGRFLLFLEEKRCWALVRFSCALWRVIRFTIYIDFGGGSRLSGL